MVAVVLDVGGDFIRVVSPRSTGGFKLYLRDLEWVTETGEPVRVETMLLGDEHQVPSPVAPRQRPLARRKTVSVARAYVA